MKTKQRTQVIKAKRRAKIVNAKVKDIDEYFRRDEADEINSVQFYTGLYHTPQFYIQDQIRVNY